MKPSSEELRLINSRLPAGASVLESQVEVLPFMMFDNQETDRATIMTPEMMKKIMKDLNEGRVSMNAMHRSHSTLPAGRSISGKVVNEGNVSQLLAKMYVVTQRPDGTPLEDGKDLADRYNTGAVYACSAGVVVGFYKCSICGNDIRDYQACDHWPGEMYMIDEKSVRCIAYMTGRDIQNGMAMDCGAYELSAVTAGGVRNASVLTETFGKYQEGANIADFKKSSFEGKDIADHVTFFPATGTQNQTEEHSMSLTADDVKKIMDENYGPLVQAKAALEVENSQFKATIETLEKAKEEFSKKITDLETAAAEATTQLAEFSAKVEALTAEAAAEKTGHEAFRAAFVAVVEAEGNKIERTAEYATMTLEGLSALYEEYKTEVAKLPSGQHSNADTDGNKTVENVYDGVPAEFFKTA